jgi:hypothetical protein
VSARTPTLEASLAAAGREVLQSIRPTESEIDRIRRVYRNDPVGFARDVLGVTPWSRQCEIFEAVVAHRRVSVRSGRKVGKSLAFACLALWFYCTRERAQVIITAVTADQIKNVIWREIEWLALRARVVIPGAADIALDPRTGLRDPITQATIRGVTARETEALSGTSGPAIMYLVDEASGVEQRIFDIIRGNMAGGNAWLCMISNPTRNEGEHFDSHFSQSMAQVGKHGYFTIAISSRESPNVTGEWRELGSEPIPGLATAEWIESEEQRYGADSPWIKVHIDGVHALGDENRLFSIALLRTAQMRHAEVAPEGRLWIGIDPAGPGDQGDESAFVLRRGRRIVEIWRSRGLSDEQHLTHVLRLIAQHSPGGKELPPVVNVDADGNEGAKVLRALRDYSEKHGTFELHAVRLGQQAAREPHIYAQLRDELAMNACVWMRDGGAIPADAKLEKDLYALAYQERPAHLRGRDRLKLIPKAGPNGLRALLGRSPDTGDAFQLACYEPARYREQGIELPPAMGSRPEESRADPYGGGVGDPYGSRIDPYG